MLFRSGWVSSLRTSGTVPLKLISFAGTQKQFINELEFTTTSEHQLRSYEIERSDDGILFRLVGSINPRNSSYNRYRYEDRVNPNEKIWYYRIKVIDMYGAYHYSKVVRLQNQMFSEDVYVFPNPAFSSMQIHVSDPGNLQNMVRLFDAQGKLHLEQYLKQKITTLQRTGSMASGLYLLQVTNKKGEVVKSQSILFR